MSQSIVQSVTLSNKILYLRFFRILAYLALIEIEDDEMAACVQR